MNRILRTTRVRFDGVAVNHYGIAIKAFCFFPHVLSKVPLPAHRMLQKQVPTVHTDAKWQFEVFHIAVRLRFEPTFSSLPK